MKKLMLALLLCTPAFVFAQGAGQSNVVYLNTTNLQIRNDSNPRALVYVPITGSGCTNTNAALLAMDSSNPLANAMYATLLTAQATGQAVQIFTSGCSGAYGYPLIYLIYVEN